VRVAHRGVPEPDHGVRFRHVPAVLLLCWSAGRWRTAADLAVTVLGGLLPAGVVWLTKLAIDGLVAGRSVRELLAVSGALAAAGLATAALPLINQVLQQELRRRLDRMLKERLYDAVNGFNGLSRFEDPRLLDRLRMAAQATGATLTPVTTGLFGMFRSVITLVGLLGTVYLVSPVMAAIVLAGAVPLLVARLSLSRHQVGLMARLTPATRRELFYSALITDVPAAKEVRLLGLGAFLKGRPLGELDTQQAGERRLDRREFRVQLLLALLGAAVAGGGLLLVVAEAAAGRLGVGDFSAFVAATAGAQAALVSLVDDLSGTHEALLIFGYHTEVTRLPDDVPARAAGRLPDLRRGIELRDVWFRYDDRHPWVLQGVDLTIPYGSAVALVGLNGAGKSTLIKLLCRFYDPQHGSIRWDSVDIRDVPVADLRRCIGALFQDFMCYDLTAAENIGIGDLEAVTDHRRIMSAARQADIDTTLAGLPKGYHTLLSRIFFDEADDVVLSGVSGSGSRSPARSCAPRGICSSWTSRAPAWTPRPSTRCIAACAGTGRADQPARLAPAQRRPRRRPHRHPVRWPHRRTRYTRPAPGRPRRVRQAVPPAGQRLRERGDPLAPAAARSRSTSSPDSRCARFAPTAPCRPGPRPGGVADGGGAGQPVPYVDRQWYSGS